MNIRYNSLLALLSLFTVTVGASANSSTDKMKAFYTDDIAICDQNGVKRLEECAIYTHDLNLDGTVNSVIIFAKRHPKYKPEHHNRLLAFYFNAAKTCYESHLAQLQLTRGQRENIAIKIITQTTIIDSSEPGKTFKLKQQNFQVCVDKVFADEAFLERAFIGSGMDYFY